VLKVKRGASQKIDAPLFIFYTEIVPDSKVYADLEKDKDRKIRSLY
jgi:hypothetical protein